MDNRKLSEEEARKLAGSPAGQELIRLLQEKGGEKVRIAMEKASAGDLSQIGIIFSVLKDNPEALKLLQQLGGSYGSRGR